MCLLCCSLAGAVNCLGSLQGAYRSERRCLSRTEVVLGPQLVRPAAQPLCMEYKHADAAGWRTMWVWLGCKVGWTHAGDAAWQLSTVTTLQQPGASSGPSHQAHTGP